MDKQFEEEFKINYLTRYFSNYLFSLGKDSTLDFEKQMLKLERYMEWQLKNRSFLNQVYCEAQKAYYGMGNTDPTFKYIGKKKEE